MPCNCDHLEPRAREREGKKACELLVYAADATGLIDPLPKWVRDGAEYVYGPCDPGQHNGGGKRVDKAVDMLCRLCRTLHEPEHEDLADTVLYDGRNRQARKLADWWEDHKEADAKAGRS